MRKLAILAAILALLAGVLFMLASVARSSMGVLPRNEPVGTVLDSLDGVPVYANGLSFSTSHGRHYADDGYYFGQKWQCVEFIKRYLYVAKGHNLPNVWGHAKHFFDDKIAHGKMNPARGMLQFKQGGDELPRVGDLLVLDLTSFGHVAIISQVFSDQIEVVQQNSGKTRAKLPLQKKAGAYYVGTRVSPARGWLRIP